MCTPRANPPPRGAAECQAHVEYVPGTLASLRADFMKHQKANGVAYKEACAAWIAERNAIIQRMPESERKRRRFT